MFDTSVAHSFITPYFVKRTGLVLRTLDKLLKVSSPLGTRMMTDSGVRECMISVFGHLDKLSFATRVSETVLCGVMCQQLELR